MDSRPEPLRALIVDDEEEFVHALSERLRLRGIDASGATTGQEALDLVRKASFDVVLLDVRMPGLGGLKIIEGIKAAFPNLPVVLLTGHGSTQDAEKGMHLGAYDYLMKPVDIDDLVRILAAAAEGRAYGAPDAEDAAR